MTRAFRLKSFPELLANMLARARALRSRPGQKPFDLNPGSAVRTLFELACLNDADAFVQIDKLLRYFSIDRCRGDDVDRRAQDFGTLFLRSLRRLAAAQSVVKLTVGDGANLVSAQLAEPALEGDTSFEVEEGWGDEFPSSGAAWLERGSARQEKVVYLRTGDVFSVVHPADGLAYAHAKYGEVARVATQSTLAGGVSSGVSSITLSSGTGAAWPISGSTVLDRGTVSAETKTFTRAGDVLTLGSPTTFAHAAGSFAVVSTAGSDRSIPEGTEVYVPASESSKQVTFVTLAEGVLLDGDLWSDLIDAECLDLGSETNVGSGTVTKFSSDPFSGAVVTNPLPAANGRSREEDDDYVVRLKRWVASWSGKTPLAIETHVVGLYDEVTNRRVDFAQLVQPVLPTGVSILYVTDGSPSFSAGMEVFSGRDVVISDAAVGDRRGRLHSSAPYAVQASPLASRTPRIYVSVNRGASTSVGVDFLEDTSQDMATDEFVNMYLKTDDDQFFRITSNTAVRFNVDAGGGVPSPGSYAVLDFGALDPDLPDTSAYVVSSSTAVSANTLTDGTLSEAVDAHVGRYLLDADDVLWEIESNTATAFTLVADGATPAAGSYRVIHSPRSLPLEPGVDFSFNHTNGDLEVADVLEAHDAVVAAGDNADPTVGAYSHATGLVALVQRAVNGDTTNFDDFMGVKAPGVWVVVAVPTTISVNFQISVLPKFGVATSQLYPLVSRVVRAYVNGLGIGEEVLESEIVKLVKLMPGVADVSVLSPAGNVPVADGQIVRLVEDDVEVV